MKKSVLNDQILLVKEKTDKLILDISRDRWFETPAVLKTNLNWQIGHIILANYLHGIASISGANAEFREKANIAEFAKFYGPKSNPSEFETEKPSSEKLIELYEYTFELIFKGLSELEEDKLDDTTEVPNPSVKTKYEALSWMPQHQSWHNGQIAILKRVLNS